MTAYFQIPIGISAYTRGVHCKTPFKAIAHSSTRRRILRSTATVDGHHVVFKRAPWSRRSQAQRPHCPRRTAGGACVYQGLLPLPVHCLKTRRNTKNKEGENLLTSASWSKRPKSSLRSLTSSCAVHCDARTVKPTMSAKTMLQGEEQTVYSMPRPQRTALRLEPECLR